MSDWGEGDWSFGDSGGIEDLFNLGTGSSPADTYTNPSADYYDPSAQPETSIFSTVVDALSGKGSVVSSLLSTAVTGYSLYKLTQATTPASSAPTSGTTTTTTPDLGVLLPIPASSENRIPVMYGEAYMTGIITEATMSADHKTMTYVMTLCEKTGTLLSTSAASVFTFKDIYIGSNRIEFQGDGVTANSTIDPNGNLDYNIQGLVKVWCYSGSSANQVSPYGYSIVSTPAYSIVPNWTYNHTMDNLVFCVVQVTYNKDRGITGIPGIVVNLINSMTEPGDCIYDYMTNTIYGAAIPTASIYA